MSIDQNSSECRRCVVLGAGAPHQGDRPTLLESVDGVSVFDWLLNALALPESQIDLVLGYQSAAISDRYPGICTYKNPHWQTTGSVTSLLQVDLSEVTDLFVCYGDILFRNKLVEALSQTDAPIAVAWDSHWKQRYVDRDPGDMATSEKLLMGAGQVQRLGSDIPLDWAHGEFIGLVRFSGVALEQLRFLQSQLPESLSQLHLSGLVEWLRVAGLPVVGCDVAGDWAEVNQSKDIAHFVLGTKAETLSRLRSMISAAVIQDQVSFTTAQWRQAKQDVLNTACSKFSGVPVVVRSSARSEDAFTHSNAGAYTSLLNVDVMSGLEAAIETVIASYHDLQSDDQVLIQPMVQQVVMSGVAFTRTLERGAPWYVINYEESGATDGITAGSSNDHKTLYVRRDAGFMQIADQRLVPLVKALSEIERLLAYDALDVEFALDRSGVVHVLQVRPIAVEQCKGETLTSEILGLLHQAEVRWDGLIQAPPHLVGSKSVYGVMPDWNPAEIVGTHPGRLAETLYRYLILDEVWATQRAEYGYRDVRPQPLLVSFAGKPYIDVRASFNSFVPASVSDELADRLVSFYLDWLCRHPHLHDKVEFDVVPTCLGLDFGRWRQRLGQEAGLSEAELDCLQDGLRRITANAIERTSQYLADVSCLEQRFSRLQALAPVGAAAVLERVRLLLDDCRMLGTLPFAHLARSGFVAVTLLKEAVATGVIRDAAREQFMASVRTVSHELSEDAHATATGDMAWEDFVDRYGHLRPGTYDLVSQAYRDDPEKYLRPLLSGHESTRTTLDVSLWQQDRAAFFAAIRSLGMDYTDVQLEQFLRDAIEGREKAKFIFTRNLSAALDLLAYWGELNDLTREELADLSLHELLGVVELAAAPDEIVKRLRESAAFSSRQREISLACELPGLICKKDDFYSFLLQEGQPNFIGSTRVLANCINLADVALERQPDVSGCIVMIPQADPGYDWLFGQGIAGLVTMYGGANSHMAIRAAEFGLPAAIGIGEQLYRQLGRSSVLELDPANARLKALHG